MEVLDDDGRQQVDQQLEDWRQGDCVVGEQWFLFRTDVARPLTDDGAAAAEEGAENAEGEAVLDHMGTHLHNLQKLASQSEALWCVALGLYRAPFQSAAIHYETPFSVVMIWGRSVGRDGPMSRAYFHSLAELDRAMCSATEVAQFFELATHKQPSPRVDEPPDIEQLIARSHIPRKRKQTLLALYKWPDKPMALRTYLRQFATDTCSEYSLKHYTLDYIERGIVKGYKPNTSKHNLKIDEQALIAYLLTADHE